MYNWFDSFAKNQHTSLVHTWGAQGTIMPYAHSSDDWKSVIDEDGMGIICFFDELWVGCHYYFNDNNSESGQPVNKLRNAVIYEFRFRPRQIKATDLLLMMYKRTCSRPCNVTPMTNYWPVCEKPTCGNPDKDKDYLPDTWDDVKDADKWTVGGDEITGAELKKLPNERANYKTPCIPVCTRPTTQKNVVCKYEVLNHCVINFALRNFESYWRCCALSANNVERATQVWHVCTNLINEYDDLVKQYPRPGQYRSILINFYNYITNTYANLETVIQRKAASIFTVMQLLLFQWHTIAYCNRMRKSVTDWSLDENLEDYFKKTFNYLDPYVKQMFPFQSTDGQPEEFSNPPENCQNDDIDAPEKEDITDASPPYAEPHAEDEVQPRSPLTDRMEFA